MNVSVIIPSIRRVGRLLQALDSISNVHEIVVVTDDPETIATCRQLDKPMHIIEAHCNAIEGWNIGAAHATGDWFVLIGDDCVLLPGWLEAVQTTPNRGFVGLYEGYDVGFVGHYAISRDCACEVLNGVVMVPHYKSWWVDQETCWHIHQAGRYAATRKIVCVHNHFSLGRAPHDEIYARGYAWHAEDEATFKRRQTSGFPVDWEPIISKEVINANT